jgi:signal transduction histidine kinase
VRHGTGRAKVIVEYGDDEVEFTVENPTNGEISDGENHGLTGMRERVQLLGGRLEVARDDGRFRVSAVLPYDRTFDRSAHLTEQAGRSEPQR